LSKNKSGKINSAKLSFATISFRNKNWR